MAAFSVAGPVFSFQTRGDFGGYLVWHSHPPPVLIPAHAMKQNTGDMSGSKTLSGSQKHLPKYLHLLFLFIHHQCGSLDLLLVFQRTSTFPIFPHFRESLKKNKKKHNTFSFLFVFWGKVNIKKRPINSVLICAERRRLRG